MENKKKPDPIDIHVGTQVRFRRMMLGMSQEKLGEQLGITFQQVQKYEKGSNRVSASRLQHIARVFSLPVAVFFEGANGMLAKGTNQQPTNGLSEFLSSEGLRLNRAFVRIKDRQLRRRIIDLVRMLAGED
jgi:transcriptional regulator with XRE-family HTH domain